jgi:hypothetical protein
MRIQGSEASLWALGFLRWESTFGSRRANPANRMGLALDIIPPKPPGNPKRVEILGD